MASTSAQNILGKVRIKSALTLQEIHGLAFKLSRRKICGSFNVALATAHLLLLIVKTEARSNTFQSLINILRAAASFISKAQPSELAVGSIVRRALRQMREEYQTAAEKFVGKHNARSLSTAIMSDTSLFSMTTAFSEPPSLMTSPEMPGTPTHFFDKGNGMSRQTSLEFANFNKRSYTLAPLMQGTLEELLDDLLASHANVAADASKHIHSSDLVMTIGYSKTVEMFLLSAAQKDRMFTVVVVEAAPFYSSHKMAKSLSAAGIDTILIPDSGVYALMARISKVILGAHAILANGGIFSLSGTRLIVEAAKVHATPVAVCSAQFKLSPLWNVFHDYSSLDYTDPTSVLSYEEGDLVGKVQVAVNYFDYIQPDLISVFITNFGDHPPNAMHKLVRESYDDVDIDLDAELVEDGSYSVFDNREDDSFGTGIVTA